MVKVSKSAMVRNRYNQVQHLTVDTNGKMTNPQLDTTNQSQEVSPFPTGDHKAHINRRAQRYSKHKTEKHIRSTKSNISIPAFIKVNTHETEASFLNLILSISNDIFSTKIYNKRDDFDFEIVRK